MKSGKRHMTEGMVLPNKEKIRTHGEKEINRRNLIKGINNWAIRLVKYSGPFLKWTREELKQMDPRTRKLMTMHKALHPRDDIDRLYVTKKKKKKEEEEDLLAVKKALINRYINAKFT